MGIEIFEYLFGGALYLISSKFREKKNNEWASKSNMYKIYEVGMWVSVYTITGLIIITIFAQ